MKISRSESTEPDNGFIVMDNGFYKKKTIMLIIYIYFLIGTDLVWVSEDISNINRHIKESTGRVGP